MVDRTSGVGRTHAAGICDIQVESALSTICDGEDSACTVDAADKIVACVAPRAVFVCSLSALFLLLSLSAPCCFVCSLSPRLPGANKRDTPRDGRPV